MDKADPGVNPPAIDTVIASLKRRAQEAEARAMAAEAATKESVDRVRRDLLAAFRALVDKVPEEVRKQYGLSHDDLERMTLPDSLPNAADPFEAALADARSQPRVRRPTLFLRRAP